jgi:hypothetical protein
MSKLKEVREENKDLFIEQNNKRFNDEREQFVKDFRKVNSIEMIKRLHDFLRIHDDVTINENGLYGFGAFNKSFFSAPQAPGSTGMEIFAMTEFAKAYTKEYLSIIISALAKGTLKEEQDSKEPVKLSENDFKAKE